MDHLSKQIEGLRNTTDWHTTQTGDLQAQVQELSKTLNHFINETNAKEQDLIATHDHLKKVHESLLEEKRQDLRNYEEDYAWHKDTLKRLQDIIISINLINEQLKFHDKEIRELHKMAYIQGQKYQLFSNGRPVPSEQDLGSTYRQRSLGRKSQNGSLPSLSSVMEFPEPAGIPSNETIERLHSPNGPSFTFGQSTKFHQEMQHILDSYSPHPP